MQDNAGRKTFLAFYKKDRFLDLMIINFEIELHTNILCKCLRVYEWVDQKWLSVHFLFLSRSDINSGLEIPVSNFCRLITPQLILGMAGVWPPEISIVYDLWIQFFLNQSLKFF